jgi:Rhamnan synthesis protein F
MLTLPLWKLSRELKRLRSQVYAIAEFFYEPLLRSKQYKRRTHSQFQTNGLVDASPKVAIFLVFQPTGIVQTTLNTCKHLLDNHYAPLLVINGAISDHDLNQLRPLSWKIIRRENYGYDFGGYQDAVWVLQKTQPFVENLLILNDSIWFPAQEGSAILQEMESRTSDFTGALQLEAYRSNQGDVGSKPPFFGSFFIHIKGSAYLHPVFKDFWRNYKATSNKYMTIRRGERSFSRTLMDAGLSHDYIFSRRMFDAWLVELSPEELLDVLKDLVSMEEVHDTDRTLLLQSPPSDPAWRQKAINLAHRMTEKQNILSSAPIASLKHFNVPYIKKSADPHNLRALALIAQHHRDGSLNLNSTVYLEICQLLAKHQMNDA